MIASDRVGSCSFAAALKHDGGEKEKERGRGRFLSARFHILLAQILPLLRPNSVRWQMMASLDGELAENGRRGQGKEKRSGGNHRQGFGYNIFAGGSRRPRPRYCNRNAYRHLPATHALTLPPIGAHPASSNWSSNGENHFKRRLKHSKFQRIQVSLHFVCLI